MTCQHDSWTDLDGTIGGDYRRCDACGLEEQKSLSDIEERFVEAQGQWYGADDPACLTPFALALSKSDATYRTRILTEVAPRGRLLEIGPGAGLFAEAAAAAGYDVVAIEDSAVLAAAVRARGVNVHQGTFESVDFRPEEFDVVVNWHVIEHVLDPAEFLRQAARVTKPGGRIIVGTPNAASLEHRLARRLSPNYSLPHLRLFTPDSLADVLVTAGWEPLERRTTDEPEHWMKVGAGLVRAVMGRQVSPSTDPNERPPLAVQSISAARGMAAVRVVGALTWLPRALQARFGRGNEVVVVGRRPEVD